MSREVFVYGIPVKKFAQVLAASKVENPRFTTTQFEKNYESGGMEWCMLFDGASRQCLAAAALRLDALGLGDTCLNEIQSLKKGFGKKILEDIAAKHGKKLWLIADPDAVGDKLLRFYRGFGFAETVVEKSVYGKPAHFFVAASGSAAAKLIEAIQEAYAA